MKRFLIILSISAAFFAFLWIATEPKQLDHIEYGVTFSHVYAEEELGLKADEVLRGALDDLGLRRFRIPVYWERVQPTTSTWHFEDLDNDLGMIQARHGKVILAIGEKVPRWPECWEPDWWKLLPREQQRQETIKYLTTLVTRYRSHPAIYAWQVENEPYFPYGDCPFPDLSFFRKETELVRRLDSQHPIFTTDSGESSPWIYFGKKVDALGVSVYRVINSPILGIWRYWFVPNLSYARKASIARWFGASPVYVSEFQMEPWSNQPLPQTPIVEQLKTFDLKQMRANFSFAQNMRISPIDFWGVEWWYWMKEKQGHSEFWEEARRFLSNN